MVYVYFMMKSSSIIATCAGIAMVVAMILVMPNTANSGQYKSYKRSEKHEDVFRFRKMKDILPFSEILKVVRPQIQGEIIETDFEYEDGIPVYEFKYIDPSGQVIELYVDAKTGKILKKEYD